MLLFAHASRKDSKARSSDVVACLRCHACFRRALVVYAVFSTFAYLVNLLLATRFLPVSDLLSFTLSALAVRGPCGFTPDQHCPCGPQIIASFSHAVCSVFTKCLVCQYIYIYNSVRVSA